MRKRASITVMQFQQVGKANILNQVAVPDHDSDLRAGTAPERALDTIGQYAGMRSVY